MISQQVDWASSAPQEMINRVNGSPSYLICEIHNRTRNAWPALQSKHVRYLLDLCALRENKMRHPPLSSAGKPLRQGGISAWHGAASGLSAWLSQKAPSVVLRRARTCCQAIPARLHWRCGAHEPRV